LRKDNHRRDGRGGEDEVCGGGVKERSQEVVEEDPKACGGGILAARNC